MPFRLASQSSDFETAFEQLLALKREVSEDVEAAVREIIADVVVRGDRALIDLTARFDSLEVDVGGLRIPAGEIAAARSALPGGRTERDSRPPDEVPVPWEFSGPVATRRFSPQQRALFDVVLEAQLKSIDQVRSGKQWKDVHDTAVRAATEGMVELGILKGAVDDLIESEDYKRFYVHNTGHWLGLDVHDVGEYTIDGHSRELEPGMVLTVEPGIYITPGSEGVDERWQGIGIRIEDDVAVTRDEPRILTDGLVKSVADIEALMAG